MESQVDEVKNRIDIVGLINEYVPLKKAGRNYKGLCPFHNEKTPSFMVSPDRQIFKCFGCFPKGSLIKTPTGLRPIESIEENDIVTSGKGLPRKVMGTHKRYFEGRLIEIVPRKLNYPTILTEDHQVYRLKTAPYLKKYKYLSKRLASYLKLSEEKRRARLNKYFQIDKIRAGNLEVGDYLLYPINRVVKPIETIDLAKYQTTYPNHGRRPRNFPKEIPVNEDALKLIGYYLAEGSNHRAYIRFSLGPTEMEFAKEITRLLKKIFGLSSSIYRRTAGKTGIEVTCCNSLLSNLLENFCGKGVANKHVPYSLSLLKPGKQKILVDSVLRGDGFIRFGNKSSRKEHSISTISATLAEQLIDILLRNAIYPNIAVGKERKDKKGANHRKSYTISWLETAKQYYSKVYTDKEGIDFWVLPIRELSKRKFRGFVYNLKVEEDHSYVANNFSVGNCGEGGDVFAFMKKMEGMEFGEALRSLAQRAGVQLKEYKPTQAEEKKETLLKISQLATDLFHYLLTKHKLGERANLYLKGRGITKKSIEDFQLGIAPPQRNFLLQFLVKKGFSTGDIVTSGLVVSTSDGLIDRFHGRIMFPISDTQGKVIAFSGRILGEGEPKYLNSPETPLFIKSKTLYGINLAKTDIKKEKEAILVEGNLDVISSHQVGVTNVVAPLGTAITGEQVDILKRFSENLLFAFDSDLAGDSAAKRGIELAENAGLNIKVVRLLSGKDPDEVIKKDPLLWKRAIKEAESIYDYFIDSALERYGTDSPEGKRKIAAEILPQIARLDDEILRSHYLQVLGLKLNVEEEDLREALNKYLEKEQEGGQSNVKEILEKPLNPKVANIVEKYLLALLIQSGYTDFKLEGEVFTEAAHREIFGFLRHLKEKKADLKIKKLAQSLPEALLPAFDELLLFEVDQEVLSDSEKLKKEIDYCVTRLKELNLRTKLKELSLAIKQAEASKNQEKLDNLSEQFRDLTKNLINLER